MDYERLCTGCMTQKRMMAYALYAVGMEGHMMPHYIAQGTILNGRYYIGKVLGMEALVLHIWQDMVLNTKLQ